jgi:hypothetical protein
MSYKNVLAFLRDHPPNHHLEGIWQMRSVTAEAAASDRFLIEGPGPKAWIHNYINEGRTRADGSPRTAGDMSPMIYLVDQEPNSSIDMHFHQVDQFQIFTGGSGRMGRHPLLPVTVHYTNAHTGYGPLQSGPDGLQYLTIRSRWDPGLRPLPEARDELPPAGSYKMRQRTTEPSPPVGREVLASLRLPQVRALMQEDGGAGAWLVALPPHADAPSPADEASDRVIVVVAGAMARENGSVMSCQFAEVGEPITLIAGPSGAEVLVLQFRVNQGL